MASIPGPIITFKFDLPQSASAAQGAFEPVKKEARQTTAQIADDWKRMAARIRADAAQGVLTTKQEADARSAVVSRLELQIRAMNRLGELNTKQLAQYKAMTLELERQQSHLSGTGGLTAGTHAAIGQFSTQTYLGVTRALDALVNRYFGGTAGSLFRTARDLGYYSSIGAGAAAGEGGAGIFSKLTSPAGLATIGGVGALTAAGVAIGVMADKGAKLSLELTDLAHETGLTTENAIRLRTAASVLGVSVDSLSVGFKTFSKEIVAANAGNKQAAAIFRALGVDVKRAAADPYSAIQQLAVAFAKIPDGALKTATATKLFGRGGQQLLPILSDLVTVEDLTKKSSQDLAHALGTDVYDSTIKLRAEMVNWRQETEALEISLGRNLIPALITTVEWINKILPGPDRQGIDQILGGKGVQFTRFGRSEFELYRKAGFPGLPQGSGPGTLIDQFEKWVTTQLGGKRPANTALFESIQKAAQEAAKAAVDVNSLRSAVGGLGKDAKTAEQRIWQQIGEQLYRTGEASGHPFYPVTADQVLQRVFNPQRKTTPSIGGAPGGAFGTNFLPAGIGGISSSVPTTSQGILQVILGGDYSKIFDTREQQYKDELTQLKSALDQKLISYQQYNTAVLSINDDLHKELLEKNREFNRQADELFNQLISGDRNLGRTLVNDIKNILLSPIRSTFDQVVGGIFGGLSRGVNAGFNGTVGAGLSRFATVPFLGNLIPGLSGKGNAPTGTASDPVHVVFGAGTATGSAGGSGGGIGGLIGSLFGGGGSGGGLLTTSSDIGNLPFIGPGGSLVPSSGSSSSGGILGFLGKIFGGGKGKGGSLGSAAAGLGTIGGGLLMGLGASTGGALGGFEGAAGGALSGALTGLTLGGPIGAAIGGIVGGIGGLISGIIGPSFQDRVRKSMVNQQYYLPPSETFSFASNGSIGNTLSTGFSSSGGKFSQFGLPANTPFYASPIQGPLSYSQYLALQNQQNTLNSNQPFLGFPGTNPYVGQGPVGNKAAPVNFHVTAIDAKGVSDFFTQHADSISAIITSRSVGSASSRWGKSVRQSASLP